MKKNVKRLKMWPWLMVLLWLGQAHALQIWTTGNTTNVNRSTEFGLCLAGGGSDDA